MVDNLEKKLPVDKNIETVSAIEKEGPIEKDIFQENKKVSDIDIDVVLPQTSSTVSEPQYRDEDLIVIESILSEDVLDLYNQLSEMKKKVFKQRGEQIAFKIKIILRQSKVKVEEIFNLIKNWLKMLPNINHYFLEQEAKIKTDKVLKMRRDGQVIEK